jgi:hypothetical protein
MLDSFKDISNNVCKFLQIIQIQCTPSKYKEYNDVTQKLLNSCVAIEDILTECFINGNQIKGYQKLKSFLDSNFSAIQYLYAKPQDHKSLVLDNLYRLANKGWCNGLREDLFHPPFEKAEDIAKKNKVHGTKILINRYSNTDFLCLYLGTSLDLCLKELNSTNKDVFFAAKFKLCRNQTLKVLNFGYRWNEALFFCHSDSKNQTKIDFFEGWLTLFPLMLACSIVRTSANYDEYVLPQLLMKYIIESTELDGIRYFSTKKDYFNIWDKNSLNFAFPAKNKKESGFDEVLAKKFKLTKPVDLAKYKTLKAAEKYLDKSIYRRIETKSHFSLIFGFLLILSLSFIVMKRYRKSLRKFSML